MEWREMVPVIQLAFDKILSQKATIKAHLGNSFRRPTLNDLYWNPGGNLQLKAEKGKGGEIHLLLHSNKTKKSTEFSLGSFYRILNNAIQWVSGSSYWYPINNYRVQNYGLQSEIFHSLKMRKNLLGFQGGYTFTKSLVYDQNYSRLQQIFVPLHKAYAQGYWKIKRWKIGTGIQYNGFRFISTDNKYQLPAYFLQDAALHIENIIVSKYQISGQILVENIWNTRYENMPGRPMPGRWIKIGLHIKISP